MPTVPPGSPANVTVFPTATQVATINPSATNAGSVFNQGPNVVYVGQSGVTPANGVPVAPNTRLELVTMPQPLYACSGYGTTLINTTTTAVANAGTNSVATLTAAAGFVTGAWVAIGSGANVEVVQITNGGGTTTLGFTAATNFVYDHKSGATLSVVTATQTSIVKVNQGVI